MSSPIQEVMQRLVRLGAVDEALAELTTVERAALSSAWRGVWARPEQLSPPDGWRSFGLLGGRGAGKTLSGAKLTIDQVHAGNATRIGLCAQSADETLAIMVNGESGLIAQAPPWFKPAMHNEKLVWPNGAFAELFSAEAPQAPRGHQFDLVWMSELAAFPPSRREEIYSNLQLSLRLGLGLFIWDTTPKRRNPLIRELLARSAADPIHHVVMRATTYDNAINLSPGAVDEWSKAMGGTAKGREELEGIFLDGNDDEGLVNQTWIDSARRDMPTRLERRIISVDPAISMRQNTDATGLVELGLGTDAQIYVISDHTDRYRWEDWCNLVVTKYLSGQCDLVVLERNRGGDSLVAGVRSAARDRGLSVVVVENDARTRWVPGTIYATEVISRQSKENRLEPVAGMYSAGKISHVRSADLVELENQLTTWLPEGNQPSPNALDALVWGAWILSGIGSKKTVSNNFAGVEKANRMLRSPPNTSALAAILRGSGGARSL